MRICQVYAVYWSATGNSRKTAETIAGKMAECLDCSVVSRDFTLPGARESDLTFSASDAAVFCLPTYAGKLPNKVLPYLQTRICGNGALAVGAVTFGNRSFDNSLAELCDVLEQNHFRTIAAGAFAARHAFTDRLAPGRPDEADLAEMKYLAEQAAAKITVSADIPGPVRVPGDSQAPYYTPKGLDGQPARFLKAKPATDPARCTGCGACARLCPMGSISPENPAEIPGTCIKCQRCVRFCPQQAKYFSDKAFLSHVAMLEQNFREQSKNAVFL